VARPGTRNALWDSSNLLVEFECLSGQVSPHVELHPPRGQLAYAAASAIFIFFTLFS